ncbi:MAG: hypothetical protein K0S07_773, partial [Chlamydiales bacterium]|nr:hypothetical protein [Chlamydiales bacterium]
MPFDLLYATLLFFCALFLYQELSIRGVVRLLFKGVRGATQ